VNATSATSRGSTQRSLPGAPGPAARLHGRRIERGLVGFDAAQPLVQCAPGLRIPAGADAAGIAQHAILVIGQQHATDLAVGARAVGVANDDELLALRALQLEPAVTAPRDVGRVFLLDDDAFHAELARGLQHARRRQLEFLAQADAIVGRVMQRRLQQRAA
jgi:hypothetical protein